MLVETWFTGVGWCPFFQRTLSERFTLYIGTPLQMGSAISFSSWQSSPETLTPIVVNMADRQLSITQPFVHPTTPVGWGKESEGGEKKLMGWDKHSLIRKKRKRNNTNYNHMMMIITECTKQAMHSAITHHPWTDALSSSSPNPASHPI